MTAVRSVPPASALAFLFAFLFLAVVPDDFFLAAGLSSSIVNVFVVMLMPNLAFLQKSADTIPGIL